MFRIRKLTIPSTAFVAACAACSSPTAPPDPVDPGGGRMMTTTEQMATSLGVSIMSSDASGAPRLMRSIVPRAAAPGMAAEAIARDHVAALAPLWVRGARPMALVERGTQPLRNGATLVRLAQEVGGVVVDQGELRVLMHRDGSLAAVSGTLMPAVAQPSFTSSASAALEHALDSLYGSARPHPAIADAGAEAGWQVLSVADDPQLHVTEVRARQVLARDAGPMAAAWELEVSGEAPPDPRLDSTIPAPVAHRYVVADASGSIMSDSESLSRAW